VARTDDARLLGRTFRPEAASAADARRFGREALAELGLTQAEDRVLVVLGEMAVNAILHGRTEYRVLVSCPRVRTARVEVHDRNPEPPRRKTSVSRDPLTYARGVLLIDSLADRWGVETTSEGKMVWAEVDC
jgi:anti-sigma regulatory factor (Ser/Thr protein kinase)